MSGSVFISEVGSRTLAKLQEQECQHMLFYVFFFPCVISKAIKNKLNFTPLHFF